MEAVATRGVPTERGRKLKERLLASPYEVDIERARAYTKVWKVTEGTPPCMRAALARPSLPKEANHAALDALLFEVLMANEGGG